MSIPESAPSSSIRLRIASAPRDLIRFPEASGALGASLFGMLMERVTEGRLPRPALLTFSDDRIWQYDLVPLIQGRADLRRFIGAATREPGVECVALMGVLSVRLKRQDRPLPAAVTFLEWPDCSWWSGTRFLGPDRRPRADMPSMVRSAEEGYPKPGGVGGWWSMGRREGLRLHRATQQQPGQSLVH